MERSVYYYLGLAAGIALGVIIVAIAWRIRKKKGLSCAYDERQIAARGKAYKYGFFTFLIYFALYGVFQMFTEGKYVTSLSGITIGICVAVFVFASNAVWNDAYFSVQESPSYYMWLFFAVGLMNLVNGARGLLGHGEEGMFEENIMCLSVGVMFVLLMAVVVVKRQKDKKEGEAE